MNFEIKSAQLGLVALFLKGSDLEVVTRDLINRFGPASDNFDFFVREPVVFDFSLFDFKQGCPDLLHLGQTALSCGLVPVGYRAAPPAWLAMLVEHGWVEVPMDTKARPAISAGTSQASAQVIAQSVVKSGTQEAQTVPTMVVDKPLRSGQKVYARGTDLVVMAMVNQGAEVVADGNIHVYAPLRGKAMAGARGNTNARIFSLCLEPELVSIAGIYRTSETPFPKDIAGKAAQVRLSTDGQDKLLIEALKA
jgi:septum site-determining protein MinC